MLAPIRLWITGLLAAALLFAAPTAALAQGEDPPARATPGTFWRGGEVTAVGDASFTVLGRGGERHEILVTPETLFFDRDAGAATLADLAPGDRVFGAVAVDEDRVLTARLIIIVGPFQHIRQVGTLSALDPAAQSFTFTARPGRVFEVYVDAGTIIKNRAGDDLAFADLSVGDHLLLTAQKRDDGQWWATRIGLRPADQTQ